MPKTIKPTKKKIKRTRPKGIRSLKQVEFLEIMGRLELIDEEIKKEKELFDIKIKSLKLEKEYLWSIMKHKKKKQESVLICDKKLSIKKELADKYIDSPIQKEIFLNQATQFKQWANYIAGLVLTQEGKKIFTPADIKKILKERLIPNHYGKKGFTIGSLLTADVEKNSSWHNGYPSLKKVDGGKYKFIGFSKKSKK